MMSRSMGRPYQRALVAREGSSCPHAQWLRLHRVLRFMWEMIRWLCAVQEVTGAYSPSLSLSGETVLMGLTFRSA